MELSQLEKAADEAPVVKLVNLVLTDAVKRGASDIHIEPYEKEFRVRFRIDGVLQAIMSPPMKLKDAITSRLKIMAKLDISEKRLPQDGRIMLKMNIGGRKKQLDFRVSTLPTLWGEKIVLRLLDKENLRLDMTKLGFEPESLVKFEKAILKPYGMVLGHRPHGFRKNQYALFVHLASQPARHQHHDGRRSGRISVGWRQPGADERADWIELLPPLCDLSCGRIPTSFWSAKSATSKRRKSPSRPLSPATLCFPLCTPTARPRPSPA
jgi:hypothetical protein